MSSEKDGKEYSDSGYSIAMNFVIAGVWLFVIMLAFGVALEGGW